MKNSFVLLSLLILSFIPIVSAIGINMNSNFSQGQTLTAQVTGNFVNPIQIQNILLYYNGHVRVSFIPFVDKVNNTYYFYGQLDGKVPGNYSLVLKGVSYTDSSGNVQNTDISQDFLITNNTTDFTVDPGFVDTSEDFYINVKNPGNNDIIVNYGLQNSSTQAAPANQGFFASLFGNSNTITSGQNIDIPSGQTEKVLFQVENFSGPMVAVLSTANTTYSIPVIIEPVSVIGITPGMLQVQPSYINVSISTNSNTTRYLYLSNSGGQNLTNVSLVLSDDLVPYVSLSTNNVEVDTNSSIQIPMNITSYGVENSTTGYITTNYGSVTVYTTVQLNFSNNYVPPVVSNNSSPFYTCIQLSGTICNSTTTCNGQTQNAEDGNCCLGTCESAQANNSAAGPIIGWTILIIIVIIGAWFFLKKFRKAKRPFNLLEAAKTKK